MTLETSAEPHSSAQNRPIHLRYTLEYPDHLAYSLYSVRTDVLQVRRTQINRVVLAFALAVWLLFLARVVGLNDTLLIGLVSAGVGVLGYALYPRLIEAAVRRNTTAFYNRSPRARGEQEIVLEDGALVGRSSKSEHRFGLEAVEKVVETPEHVFVLLGGNNAVIVPNAAFSSAEERAEFVSRVRAGAGRAV